MQPASFLWVTAGSQGAPKKTYSQLKERVKRATDNTDDQIV